jgi:hypothetical protein
MVDRDLRDAKSTVRREDGDEAVELPVEAYPLQNLGAIRLQPAVDVVKPYAGDDCGRPVEHPREESPRERVVPPRFPARYEIEPLVELGEQLRNLRGVVLEIGVDRHDDVTVRFEKAGLERRRLAEVPTEVHDHDIGRLGMESLERGHAPVGRPVVHEDDLERLALRLECVRDLAIQRIERLLLVEQRDDDRDHG